MTQRTAPGRGRVGRQRSARRAARRRRRLARGLQRARGPAHRAARRPGRPRLGGVARDRHALRPRPRRERAAGGDRRRQPRAPAGRRRSPTCSWARSTRPRSTSRTAEDQRRRARRGRRACSTAYSARSPDAGRRSGGPSRRTPSSSGMAARQSLSRVAVGGPQVEVELEQRDQHEAPLGGLRVGQRQALGGVGLVAEQQQVDVDRARGVAHAALEVAPQLALDRLAGVEQLLGRQLGLDAHAGVEERRAGRGSRPTGSVS